MTEEAVRRAAAHERITLGWVDFGLLVGAIIWGINFAVVKQTLTEITPLAFAAVRFSLAGVLLFVILRAMGQNLHIKRGEIWKVLLLGIAGIAGTQAFFTLGIARTSAGSSSVIMATTPVFVTLFGVLLRVERITPAIALGVAFSVGGTALLVGFGSGEISFGAQVFVGNVLVLLGTVCWAVYTTLVNPLLGHYSPMKIITLVTITGSVVLLVLAAGELPAMRWAQVSWQGWLGLGYSFALSSALVYAIWTAAIQRVGNARTAVFMNVTPIAAVIASWLLLGEVLKTWQVVGAIITLAGVTLTRVAPQENPKGAVEEPHAYRS